LNRPRLTSRFFVFFAVLSLLSTLSVAAVSAFLASSAEGERLAQIGTWGWALIISVLPLSMLIWTWRDRRTLPRDGDLEIEIDAPQQLSIHEEHESQLNWLDVSQSGRLASENGRIELFDHRDSHLELLFSISEPTVKLRPRQLGYAKIDAIEARAHSRWDLWTYDFKVPLRPPLGLRVHPSTETCPEETFVELARRAGLLRLGARRQAHSRAAETYVSSREWQVGDQRRHLDVRKSARFQKPMTKEFEALHEHHLVVALDSGRGLMGMSGESRVCERYISAALAAIESALRAGDRVTFVSHAGQNRFTVGRERSLRAFDSLFRGTEHVNPTEEECDYQKLAAEIERVAGARSIVLVLTDAHRPSVQAVLAQALQRLAHRHLVALATLEPDELDVDHLALSIEQIDSASLGNLVFALELNEQLDLFRRRLLTQGGIVFTAPEKYWLSAVQKLYATLRVSARA
jgi:uncharacterized protein (DUF58 family)